MANELRDHQPPARTRTRIGPLRWQNSNQGSWVTRAHAPRLLRSRPTHKQASQSQPRVHKRCCRHRRFHLLLPLAVTIEGPIVRTENKGSER
jgi:hypothetical protein